MSKMKCAQTLFSATIFLTFDEELALAADHCGWLRAGESYNLRPIFVVIFNKKSGIYY